jgi:hypothetical protein
MIEVLYVLWTVFVAESFVSCPLIAERRMLLSVIFFVMGPGVSKVLEIGTIPVRLNKPVVGFRPISEPREIMEPEVSVPTAAAA